jgi:hypothetical protein
LSKSERDFKFSFHSSSFSWDLEGAAFYRVEKKGALKRDSVSEKVVLPLPEARFAVLTFLSLVHLRIVLVALYSQHGCSGPFPLAL